MKLIAVGCNELVKGKRSIHFFFPVAKTLTGQEVASRLILSLLNGDFEFVLHEIRAFDRQDTNPLAVITYAVSVTKLWWRILWLRPRSSQIIYLNLGQSFVAMLRDGLPTRLLLASKKSVRGIVSLHGHMFTLWTQRSFKQRLFRWLLSGFDTITVLGDVQRNKLLQMGIRTDQIEIVNNTCEFTELSKPEKKSESATGVTVLYLSNLIESKGYREFVEALNLLASCDSGPRVTAVLCGTVSLSVDAGTGDSPTEAEVYINTAIARINQSARVSLQWIPGAFGEEKRQLFECADIFVYPSRRDAQPIVLIEAMATGCALVTSAAGEIPSMVDSQCAIVLSDCTPESIAGSIAALDRQALSAMQIASWNRFQRIFSHDAYREKWTEIFR